MSCSTSKEALKVCSIRAARRGEEERCLKGLMQDDYQLTLQHVLDADARPVRPTARS